jgi:hypothetical protein
MTRVKRNGWEHHLIVMVRALEILISGVIDMAVNPKYHQETVLADSPEEQRLIANLTAQGWKLYACPDEIGKPGYVKLMFRKADPTFVAPSRLPIASTHRN